MPLLNSAVGVMQSSLSNISTSTANSNPSGVYNLDPGAKEYVPLSCRQETSLSSVCRPEKYPNNAIRQRSSNVISSDPELEFQKSALDACSTIVQQETELKRIQETLDIRNKRIMQLESQIGTATTQISSRNLTTTCINSPTLHSGSEC